MMTPEEVEREYANLLQAENLVKQRATEIEGLKESIETYKTIGAMSGNAVVRAAAKAKIKELQEQIDRVDLAGAQDVYNRAKERLAGINLDDVESGRYKERYDSLLERLKTATAEAEAAQTNYEAAQAATLAQQSERDLADAQSQQDVTHARGMVRENARQRKAQRQFKKNEDERRRNEQFAADARRQAERDAREGAREYERFGKLGRKARVEARAEKRALKDAAFTRDAYGMLAGGIDAAEADRIIANMQDAKRKNNEALWKLVEVVMELANDDKLTSESVLAKLQRERNKLDKRTKNMID